MLRVALIIGLALACCPTATVIAVGTDTIYVVQEGWHTGIVLKTNDIPKQSCSLAMDYMQHEYIDISWGDERYYQAPGTSIFLAARAVLFPTRSVIRLVGVRGALHEFYMGYTIMPVVLDSSRFQSLVNFISESFKRNKEGKIIPSTIFYPSDIYFLAKRPYHLFRTCNTWVGLALKKSGKDVSTFLLISKNQLFNRLEKIKGAWYMNKTG